MKELFGVPEDYRIACVVHVGGMLDVPKPPPKREVEEVVVATDF